ncbi:MAG: 3-oxoacyl-[acyl-carrier-protein] reductase [Acidobacteria bacterium]|nr:3-oxoacyl-[acyl-carrier-protein] reductase [Acidobacteriota bacterium]
MFSLRGCVAIVTGASQGLGRETARALAEAGSDVALVARNAARLETLAEEIGQAGRRVLCLPADVTRPEEIKAAISRIAGDWGRIDVLVNNAGITRDGLVMRMKREDWDSVLQTNLTGAFLCTQAVLPVMIKARYGRVINMASVMGQMGGAGAVNYSASKAGLIGFTKALAREVASRNITVNAVAPGFFDTAMTGELPENTLRQVLETIPLGRAGAAREVAAGVVYLASREAGYVTGHVLCINGGMYM